MWSTRRGTRSISRSPMKPLKSKHQMHANSKTPNKKRKQQMRNEYVPVPRFIQDTPRGRMEWDPYSRLANDRIIFLGTPVDDSVANLLIAQLLILESEDPDKDIIMYINSPGGEITGLFAI